MSATAFCFWGQFRYFWGIFYKDYNILTSTEPLGGQNSKVLELWDSPCLEVPLREIFSLNNIALRL